MNQRRGLGFGGFLVLVALVVLVIAAIGLVPYRQVLASERAIDLSEQKLDALSDENLRLEQQVAVLLTDGEVERLAREQFGLVMPGETGYVAVVPDGLIDPAPSGRISEFTRPDPWWRRLWDFLTGQDIASDG